MSANQLALWYLAASVLFILALKGLSSPVSARRGNLFGVIGMAIAVLVTLAITKKVAFILVAMAIGGMVGAFVARRVQMTQMPELVAAMHSLVGMAAVLIAVAVVNNPGAFGEPDPLPRGNRLELFIGRLRKSAREVSDQGSVYSLFRQNSAAQECPPAHRSVCRAEKRTGGRSSVCEPEIDHHRR